MMQRTPSLVQGLGSGELMCHQTLALGRLLVWTEAIDCSLRPLPEVGIQFPGVIGV